MTRKGKLMLVLVNAGLLAGVIGTYSLAEPPEATWPALAQRGDEDRPERPDVRPGAGRVPMPGGRPGMMPGAPMGPGMQPGMMPPGMGPGGPRQFGPQQVDRMQMMVELIGRMQHVCFEPPIAGLVAIGGLKDEVRRKPAEVIQDLEDRLKETETLGFRNAIRMILKDLYKAAGEDDKALENLRQMLRENDKALRAEERREQEE